MARRQRVVSTEVGLVELIEKRREEELIADRIGSEIHLLTMRIPDEASSESFERLAIASTAGPLLFFTLQRLLASLRARLRGAFRWLPGDRDHPSAAERRARYHAAVADAFTTLAMPEIVEKADSLELARKLPFIEECVIRDLERRWLTR